MPLQTCHQLTIHGLYIDVAVISLTRHVQVDCMQHIIQTRTHLWHFSDHMMTTHLNKVTGNGKKNTLRLRLAEVIVATDCFPTQPAHVTATRTANHLVTAETSSNTDVKLMCTQSNLKAINDPNMDVSHLRATFNCMYSKSEFIT